MKPGDFVWHELCTPDLSAAGDFYTKVVGWTVKPSVFPGIDYNIIHAGEREIGGIMSLPAGQMPPRPVWFGYIGVENVDAKAEEIKAAGGTIHKAPDDIPKVGRFAVVADPQGAVFLLFKGEGEVPAPLPVMHSGSVGWNELHTNDAGAAWSFYEKMFGWSKDAAHDMGPMGTYQLFKASGMACGGFMNDTQSSPHPYWLYYFVVDDIDAGVEKVNANGGSVLFGPQEVPGGAWIINAQDPQGAVFALVGMKKNGRQA